MAEVTEVKEVKKEAKSSMDESKVMAALSYLWILSVVFYILKKEDEYVQFHAKQGIVIFGISILGFVPFLGIPFGLLALVLVVIGALKAYSGEKYRIPFVADVADKINF